MHDILCSRFTGLHYLYVIFSDLFKADFAKDKLQDMFEGGQGKDKNKDQNQAGGNLYYFPLILICLLGEKKSQLLLLSIKAKAV